MSYFKLGNGYIGSSKPETTNSENYEVVPEKPEGWSHGYVFYKFSLMNYHDCTVKVNNSEPIFLKANQGFQCDYYDQPIKSFVIVEEGIDFNWIGAW